jgi:hypothetical protein
MPFRIALAVILMIGMSQVGTAQRADTKDSKEDKKEQEKVSQAQQQETQALIKVVDGMATGQGPASAVPIAWGADFLKATEGKTYVPFTISFDPAKFPPSSLAMYLRVTKRGEGVITPPDESKKKEDDKEKADAAAPSYPFEDIHFMDVKAPPAGQPQRISRAFAVPAGAYDVYVALKPRGQSGSSAQPASIATLKQPVDVPDFWNNELATSSIILADKVEPLTAPMTKEQQVENPYTFGTTQIVPAWDTKFGKNEELSIVFLIYNTGLDSNQKPDVSVEYNFHQKAEGAEKFFNRTSPQTFNAQSLPPQFDMAAGHQLVAGQSIPLASFPEGDYRLEIKVTDKASSKALVKDVNFTVTASPS